MSWSGVGIPPVASPVTPDVILEMEARCIELEALKIVTLAILHAMMLNRQTR